MNDSSLRALCSAVTLQSNKNGFFQQVANNITASVDDHWLRDFGTLKTNKLRVIKCLTDKKIKDQVYQMMDNVQEIFRTKSAAMSRLRREEAEHLHEAGKLDKALLFFTQSVIRAPVANVDKSTDECFSLALALWGRSTVFYQLGKMKHCLEDLKLCLKEKISDNLRLDAYWRMTECYMHLEQFQHARVTLNILLQITKQMKNREIGDTWQDKIHSKLKELPACIPNEKKAEPYTDSVQQLTGGQHSQLQNASSKLKLTKNNKAGKFLVAGDKINTGDVLITEYPYVSCLSSEKYSSHCQHCLQRLETAIPCTKCSGVAFCSISCRTAALSTYHKFECSYLDLLIGSGMSVLCFAALRIISQQSIKYFADIDLDGDTNLHHPYKKIYDMINHEDERTGIDFFYRTLMSLFLMAVLKKSGYFLNSKNVDKIESQEIRIAVILLRNLEILQFNAHEISEAVKCKKTKSLKTFNIGVGLYKTASYFNHDCFPAVSRYFIGTKLIIKAVRPILINELVGDNYGPVFTKANRVDRRKKLLSRYWFECECEACLNDWPQIDKLKDAFLKTRCSSCNITLFYNETNSVLQCNKCNEYNDCSSLLKKIKELQMITEISVDDLDEKAIKNMCIGLDSISEMLHPPHIIYLQVAHKLTQFSINKGNVHVV